MSAGVFIFLVFVGVIVFIFWVAIKRTRRRTAIWSEAAQALGLDYVPAALPVQLGTLHGSCKKCLVSVGLHTERSGRTSTTYTRFVVQYPRRLPLELRITRQGFLQQVASFFGVQDIEVGDEEFDALVIIKGDDPEAVRRFLTLGRRLEIARIYARFERVMFDRKQIEALALGAGRTRDELVTGVEALVGAANLLGGRVERAPRRSPAAEEPAEQLFLETVPDLEDDRPTLDGFLEEVVEVVDEAPDVARAFAAAFADEPEVVAEPRSEATPATTPAQGTLGPGAKELGDLLFGDDASGYEVEQRFEAWQGRRVVWSGVLTEAQVFDLDFELGPGAGAKAVFEIGEHVSGFGTTSAITAVVRFPEQAHEELANRVGRRVSFGGTLHKAKGLMKEIILTDGELVA